MNNFFIDSFEIGLDKRCMIVAEISANHNGSLDIAVETIRAAKRAGADAVKFQTFKPETITLKSNAKDFLISGTIWDGNYLFDLYGQAHTPWDWHGKLFQVAKEEGLIFFSSPFDLTAVDFLESFNVPAYKIASLEITDIPLIEYVASKMKPVILSTGVATKEDIERALAACYKYGNNKIVLLKCTTSYPAPIEEANLIMVKDISQQFNVFSGLSDHTLGNTAPIVSICFGAKIVEKHFIIDRSIGGPDASFSMNEAEFTQLVKAIREAEDSIGLIDYNLTPKQVESRAFVRSLYISSDMISGDILTKDNVKSVRPGFGLHPMFFDEILGKSINIDAPKGTRLSWDIIE